jgi:predicted nicotinamide N-methyase
MLESDKNDHEQHSNQRIIDDDDDDDTPNLDPFFFDDGYTLAGRTGFQVWAGSRLLLESLLYPVQCSQRVSLNTQSPSMPYDEDPPRLQYWQQRMLRLQQTQSHNRRTDTPGPPLKILELGSGVGLVGSSIAALGHEVVLTDLPTLIKHSVMPNIKLNGFKTNPRDKTSFETSRQPCSSPDLHLSPLWLSTITSGSENNPKKEAKTKSFPIPIYAGENRGFGWMKALPLDWTKPLQDQIVNARETMQDLDLIVASDCVWLKSMLDALLDTVSSIFDLSGPQTSFILSFQRRDKNGMNNKNIDEGQSSSSSLFTTVEGVLEAIVDRGWTWECLAWRYTMVEAEEHEKCENEGGDMLRREVYAVEVRPSNSTG